MTVWAPYEATSRLHNEAEDVMSAHGNLEDPFALLDSMCWFGHRAEQQEGGAISMYKL